MYFCSSSTTDLLVSNCLIVIDTVQQISFFKEINHVAVFVTRNRNLDCSDIVIYNLWFKLEVKMPLDPKPIEFAS
jgi:hypothetical protein